MLLIKPQALLNQPLPTSLLSAALGPLVHIALSSVPWTCGFILCSCYTFQQDYSSFISLHAYLLSAVGLIYHLFKEAVADLLLSASTSHSHPQSHHPLWRDSIGHFLIGSCWFLFVCLLFVGLFPSFKQGHYLLFTSVSGIVLQKIFQLFNPCIQTLNHCIVLWHELSSLDYLFSWNLRLKPSSP